MVIIKNIKVSVKVDTQELLNLKKTIEDMSKNGKIELGLGNTNLDKYLQQILNKLTELKDRFSNISVDTSSIDKLNKKIDETNKKAKALKDSVKIDVGGDLDALGVLKERFDEIYNTTDKLAKQSISVIDDEVVRAVISYTNALGQAVKETMGWKKVIDDNGNESNMFTILKTDVTDSVQAIEKATRNLSIFRETMQKKLNHLTEIGYDKSEIERLQKELDALDSTVTNVQMGVLRDGIREATSEANKMVKELEKVKNTSKEDLMNLKAFREFNGLSTKAVDKMMELNDALDMSSTKEELEKVAKGVKELDVATDQIIKMKKTFAELKDVGSLINEKDTATVKTYKTLLAEVTKEFNRLKQGKPINEEVFAQTSKGAKELLDDVYKTDKAISKLKESLSDMSAKLSKELSTALKHGMIDENFLKGLEKSLGNIKLDGTVEELKEAKRAMSDLGKEISQLKNRESEINRLESAISVLNSQAKQFENIKFVSSDQKAKIEQLRREIVDLENVLVKLKNGGNLDINLGNAIGNARNTVRDIKTEFGGFTSIFTKGIQGAIAELGLFNRALDLMADGIREGIRHTRELDDTFIDMKMSMGESLTTEQFTNMTDAMYEMGRAMGVNSEQLMGVVKIYANAGESVDSLMQKLQGTVALSDISGMDSMEVTSAVQTALNAFKLLEEAGGNAEVATMRFGDGITAVARNLSYDFAKGIQEIIESIRTAGNVMYDAGMGVESYMGKVGAIVEATGKSGSEVANGMKFIVARTLQVKGLSEELGIAEAELGKASQALEYLGIEVQNADGSFRSIDAVLGDVSAKWGELENTERNYVAEAMAGNRQRSTFISLMETMEKSTELTNLALNSQGELMEVQGIKAEGLENKINRLITTLQELWNSIVDSDFVKGAVDALIVVFEQLIEIINFDNPAKSLAIFTTAFMGLTKIKAVKDTFELVRTAIFTVSDDCLKAVKNFGALVRETGFAKASIQTLSGVFKTLGASLLTFNGILTAITIALSVIGAVDSALEKSKQKAIESMNAFEDFNTKISNGSVSAEEYINKISELQTQLSSLESGTDEHAQVQKELNDVISLLCEAYPQYNQFISGNTEAKKLNIEASKELNEEEKNLAKLKAQTALVDNKIFDTSDIKNYIDKYKDAMERAEKASYWIKELPDDTAKKGYGKTLEKATEEAEEYKEVLMGALPVIEMFGEELIGSTEGADLIRKEFGLLSVESDNLENTLSELGGELEVIENEAFEAKSAFEELHGTTEVDWNCDGIIDVRDELISVTSKADEAKTAIENLIDGFSSYDEPIELAEKMFGELGEHGMLTDETWDAVIKSGNTELIAILAEEATAYEKLQELIPELKLSKEDYANAVIQEAVAIEEAKRELEEFNEKVEEYSNKDLETAKKSHEDSYRSAYVNSQKEIADRNDATTEKNKSYQQDVQNHKTAEEQKAGNVGATENKEVQEVQASANQKAQIYADDTNKALQEQQTRYQNAYEANQNEIAEAQRGTQEKAKAYQEGANQEVTAVEDSSTAKKEAIDSEKQAQIIASDEKLQKEQEFATVSKSIHMSMTSVNAGQYRLDVSNFSNAVSQKIALLYNLQSAIQNAQYALNVFNSTPVASKGTSGGTGRGTGSSATFMPMSSADGGSEVSALSDGGGGESSSGGSGAEGGTAPIPFALPGGVSHFNPNTGLVNNGTTYQPNGNKGVVQDYQAIAQAITATSKAVDKLNSSTKALSQSTKQASSETEKEVEDMERLNYQYLVLDDALEDVQNRLSFISNRLSDDTLSSKDRVEYINEEISLLWSQREAINALLIAKRKEAQLLQGELKGHGFGFNAEGDITNADAILESYRQTANSMSGEAKEDYIEWVENLADTVDEYVSLTNDDLASLEQQWADTVSEINNANINRLTSLREQIVDALRSERETQKEAEIEQLDSRIEELQKQLEDMDAEDENKLLRRAKLEEEIAKWNKDNSIYGKKKVQELQEELDELNKEIARDEINAEIDAIENQKDAVEDIYEQKLSEAELYYEADKLLMEGNVDAIKTLLESQTEEFAGLGNLLGESFKNDFMSEIQGALDALEYLKTGKSEVNQAKPTNGAGGTGSIATTPTGGGSPSSSKPSSSSSQSSKPLGGVGSKAKIMDLNSSIYVDSYTGHPSGTWKGAGVGSGESLYIVNENNGRVALARTNSVYGAIGWIDKKKLIAGYKVGGSVGTWAGNDGRIIQVHSGEGILTAEQNAYWKQFVEMLPNLIKSPMIRLGEFLGDIGALGGINNNISIVNNFDVEANGDFEQERLGNNIEKLILKDLRRFGKLNNNS